MSEKQLYNSIDRLNVLIEKTSRDNSQSLYNEDWTDTISNYASQAKDAAANLAAEYAPTVAAGYGAGKAISKLAGRAIPGVGTALSVKDAYDRWQRGDTSGAVLSALAGAGYLIPGVGAAIGGGLEAANIAKDIYTGSDMTNPVEDDETQKLIALQKQLNIPQTGIIDQPTIDAMTAAGLMENKIHKFNSDSEYMAHLISRVDEANSTFGQAVAPWIQSGKRFVTNLVNRAKAAPGVNAKDEENARRVLAKSDASTTPQPAATKPGPMRKDLPDDGPQVKTVDFRPDAAATKPGPMRKDLPDDGPQVKTVDFRPDAAATKPGPMRKDLPDDGPQVKTVDFRPDAAATRPAGTRTNAETPSVPPSGGWAPIAGSGAVLAALGAAQNYGGGGSQGGGGAKPDSSFQPSPGYEPFDVDGGSPATSPTGQGAQQHPGKTKQSPAKPGNAARPATRPAPKAKQPAAQAKKAAAPQRKANSDWELERIHNQMTQIRNKLPNTGPLEKAQLQKNLQSLEREKNNLIGLGESVDYSYTTTNYAEDQALARIIGLAGL